MALKIGGWSHAWALIERDTYQHLEFFPDMLSKPKVSGDCTISFASKSIPRGSPHFPGSSSHGGADLQCVYLFMFFDVVMDALTAVVAC